MNTTPSPVVVGIAGDQVAVVRWAVAEAERLKHPLRVVHSWAMPSMGAEAYGVADTTTLLRTGAELVLENARTLVDRLAPTLDADFVVEYGSTANVLIQESRDAVSLVVGSDDASWAGRLLGGELSAHLGRAGRCPVVVVPERLEPGTGTGGVAVAIDGETSAAGPLRYAFEQADSRGVRVLVLHCVTASSTVAEFTAHRANLAEVIAGWQEQFPGVEVDRATAEGNVADGCIDATARAELLVLGHHHGRSRPSDVLHPVAAAVLRGARCPVALVPLDYALA